MGAMGRLTLNPVSHLDPIGTLMLFLFGFGWAKPVPFNLAYVRDTRRGLILVSSAGIVANMILAFLAFLLYRILDPQLPWPGSSPLDSSSSSAFSCSASWTRSSASSRR